MVPSKAGCLLPMKFNVLSTSMSGGGRLARAMRLVIRPHY